MLASSAPKKIDLLFAAQPHHLTSPVTCYPLLTVMIKKKTPVTKAPKNPKKAVKSSSKDVKKTSVKRKINNGRTLCRSKLGIKTH